MMKRKRGLLVCVCVLLLLAAVAAVALDQRIIVREYTVEAGLARPVRIAVLTDTHGCDFGPYGAELVRLVADQEPDMIFLVGDMISPDGDYDEELQFFRLLKNTAYGTFYVTGNHEYWEVGDLQEMLRWIRDTGVFVLDNAGTSVFYDGAHLNISGVSDPCAADLGDVLPLAERLELSLSAARKDTFTVLLAHRPEQIGQYAADGRFDLVISGHAHGGQVRLPGLINGLCAPDQGWFPEYAGGRYEVDGTTMIVSRGLSTQAQWYVPRIFNRPELVIITLE